MIRAIYEFAEKHDKREREQSPDQTKIPKIDVKSSNGTDENRGWREKDWEMSRTTGNNRTIGGIRTTGSTKKVGTCRRKSAKPLRMTGQQECGKTGKTREAKVAPTVGNATAMSIQMPQSKSSSTKANEEREREEILDPNQPERMR